MTDQPRPSAAPELGLRERKQRELRRAIEAIAVDLVSQHTYDTVSVDMICEAADVSQRTFFNYFGTKENAVMGDEPPRVSDEQIAAIVDDPRDDTLDVLFTFLANLNNLTQHDRTMREKRREIVFRNPELMKSLFARMDALEEVLSDAVSRRLQRMRGLAESTAALREEARMNVNVVGSLLKFSTDVWLQESDPASTIVALSEARRLAARVLAPSAST
ncbi:TetR/AcrR family transcriptional regulator [Lysinibacter cavernae]|uniref:AcrR family transcriptional regulator n=1 Tax=Lysinibacter cavernae TaxID=1640652 RepID=A0A7X5R3J0_9MICO|nr:TetR/AcrR family transcriptional regulator [Lysinibacter cavernae]NIH54979.1 AcrR family transcriptional regulator [Lysinibacter cavernae]